MGELRGEAHLGERPRLEVDLLGADTLPIDASCFRLIQPVGSGDLPWLKKASFTVRKGAPKVLEIRPDTIVRDPVLELTLYLGCGHEISRQYVLFASPAPDRAEVSVQARPKRDELAPPATLPAPVTRRPTAIPRGDDAPPRLTPRRPEKRNSGRGMPDRVMLSNGIDVGDPSLRLATELFSGGAEAKEAQREILRLEFRMLMALNEQATSQLATAEKLRNMEGTLVELQQRAGEFAQRVEDGAKPLQLPPPAKDLPAAQPAVASNDAGGAKSAAGQVTGPAGEATDGLSEWSLYGMLLGILLGLGAWLGWKNHREREARPVGELRPVSPAAVVAGEGNEDYAEQQRIDLPVEPVPAYTPTKVDFELDGGESVPGSAPMVGHELPRFTGDSLMSLDATTVDEHFEANPVMELADIMLSFGRVKGAAQALQEYIDKNPQEALQPWIRLMDVYRMAGMREEFESVAHNLNQNFNVEVQQWDDVRSPAARRNGAVGGEGSEEPAATLRPESIEDMPRIADMICALWPTGDVVGYLYQLLRDNRGGKRQGFALPVVDEILFLIELKETSNRIQ